MKTFCKLTTQSPAASYVPLPRFLLQDEALRDISNDAKVLYALLLDRASISRQNGYVEPDGTIRLYFNPGTGTGQAPPQPPERHADLPGTGIQRLDRSAQAGLGKARAYYAELPSGRKVDSAKRGWRNIAQIKVENKVFSAPQALRKHRGISFPITPQKSVSMRLQKR